MFRKLSVILSMSALSLLTAACHKNKNSSSDPFYVNCSPGTVKMDTAVLLVLGQSNAANFGETLYSALCPNALNFYNGTLYPLADPVKGATGNGGSVWSRLGDMLISKGLARVVIIAPASIGGTTIETWMPGGMNNHLIVEAVDSLHAKGLHITHVLWHQGESDNIVHFPFVSASSNAQRYKNDFLSLVQQLRSLGVDAPVFIAQATRCGGTPADLVLQQTQFSIASDSLHIYDGPNTDILGDDLRYDHCHFNDAGLRVHASLWADILYRH